MSEADTAVVNNRELQLLQDVRWRERGVLERQGHLLKTGLLSDCTLEVKTGQQSYTLKVHKHILYHSSSVFANMLAVENVIRVENVHIEAIRKMLQHIYTDSVELVNTETALAVLYAADKYQINPLVYKCFHFLKQTMVAGDVCKTMELARDIGHTELENFSIQMMQHHTEPLLESAGFLDARIATVFTLLELPALGLQSEVKLFKCVVMWAVARTTSDIDLREWLDLFLPHIRFLSMSVQQFTDAICIADVLTPQEQKQIVQCLSSGTGPMPGGMSTERQARVFVGEEAILEFHTHAKINLPMMWTYTLNITTQPQPGPDKQISLRSVQFKSRSEIDFVEDISITVRYADNSFIYYSAGAEHAYKFTGPVYANKDPKYYFPEPIPLASPVHKYQILICFHCFSPRQCNTTTLHGELYSRAGVTFRVRGNTPIKSVDFLVK